MSECVRGKKQAREREKEAKTGDAGGRGGEGGERTMKNEKKRHTGLYFFRKGEGGGLQVIESARVYVT